MAEEPPALHTDDFEDVELSEHHEDLPDAPAVQVPDQGIDENEMNIATIDADPPPFIDEVANAINPVIKKSHKSMMIKLNNFTVGKRPESESRLPARSMMERGASGTRDGSRRRYQMDERSTQTRLAILDKDIKYVTVNMLNKNLIEIDLSGNKIGQVPDEICVLTKLQDLNLKCNRLKELPSNIGHLQ